MLSLVCTVSTVCKTNLYLNKLQQSLAVLGYVARTEYVHFLCIVFVNEIKSMNINNETAMDIIQISLITPVETAT